MPPRQARTGVRAMPRDVRLAGFAGLGVGALAAATAYFSYVRWGGPTLAGVTAIPLSMLVIGTLYVQLVRRRMPRASNWLALGYTAAILFVTVLLAVEETVRGIYQELYVGSW